MHVLSKRSFLCRHIAGIGSTFITGFLTGICSKFLAGFLPKFLALIPGRNPARNMVQIPGRIPANLNISRQIPQGVHTDSCRNLYKKMKESNGFLPGIWSYFPVVILLWSCWTISYRRYQKWGKLLNSWNWCMTAFYLSNNGMK